MKRLLKRAFMCLFVLFLMSTNVLASSDLSLVGFNATDDAAVILASGEVGNLTAMVSGHPGSVRSMPITESDVVGRTLFVVNVSTSMPPSSRRQTLSLLDFMIENKAPSEQFAIYTIGTEFRQLIDFTDYRFYLIRSIDDLEWSGRPSHVNYALSSALQIIDGFQDGLMFNQIILLTDGITTEVGMTREELLLQLNDSIIPVHTVGFRRTNNVSAINDLHAFSRITGGTTHELTANSQDDAVSAIGDLLAEFKRSISFIQVELPAHLRDGAIRPVELFDNSGASVLTHNMRMPLVVVEAPAETPAPAPTPVLTPAPAATPAPEPEPEPVEMQEQEWNTRPMITRSVGVAILVIALVIAAASVISFAFVRRRSKSQVAIQTIAPPVTHSVIEDQRTVLVVANHDRPMGGKASFFLVLNDVTGHSGMTHKILVDDKVEIGREPNQPGLVIDHDMKISRRHCMVSLQSGQLWIEDLGAANKTLLNNELLVAPMILRDGDNLTCGSTKFVVSIEMRFEA